MSRIPINKFDRQELQIILKPTIRPAKLFVRLPVYATKRTGKPLATNAVALLVARSFIRRNGGGKSKVRRAKNLAHRFDQLRLGAVCWVAGGRQMVG